MGSEVVSSVVGLSRELAAGATAIKLKNKVLHFTLYSTDGYININSGVWPPLMPASPVNDYTSIAGWGPSFGGVADAPENIFPVQSPVPSVITGPIYIWGFTDVDPDYTPDNGTTFPNRVPIPTGAYSGAHDVTGNAKFPAPFVECTHMDNVFITLHNRGFYQSLQAVQDDHSLHLHGIHAQTPYDGFPESAGGYVEMLRYFWEEAWYLTKDHTVPLPNALTPKQLDDWWNGLTMTQQQTLLNKYPAEVKIKENRLNPSGGIINKRNTGQPYPFGVKNLTPQEIEDKTQFTYYFSPMHMGTYMYHCHVSASEHVQMGMYGALVVRPMDYVKGKPSTWSVYGLRSNTSYDQEYNFVLSEFDARWHKSIEGDPAYANYYPALWRPDIWMTNGRTFPMTVLPFAWNKADGTPDFETRYNTYIKTLPKQRFLVRYIHMGYQSQPMHQHGWHMRIVGKDAMPLSPPRDVFTLFIGSGETYETITLADPAYGVNANAGSPLSSPHPDSPSNLKPAGTLNGRISYPIHSHDDYKVTTNGFYPGGGLVLIETCVDPNSVPKLPPATSDPFDVLYNSLTIGRPSFEDPYVLPRAGIPADRGDIEELPAPAPQIDPVTGKQLGCPGLPPH